MHCRTVCSAGKSVDKIEQREGGSVNSHGLDEVGEDLLFHCTLALTAFPTSALARAVESFSMDTRSIPNFFLMESMALRYFHALGSSLHSLHCWLTHGLALLVSSTIVWNSAVYPPLSRLVACTYGWMYSVCTMSNTSVPPPPYCVQ